MFDKDLRGNVTRRFGGFEFVPSATNVRTAGDKSFHISPLLDNTAKFNDPVPIVYGTGWLKSPVIFARNDGNLTHIEVLLGIGEMQGVVKVVVNDVEIPKSVANSDMSTTGWYSVVTTGMRQGNFDQDFVDVSGNPLGDPYGSLSVLLVVVPNRISSGKSVPNVEVLVQGLLLDSYNLDGSFRETGFTNNPAWVILNVLRRCGWSTSELNLSSFAASAAFCQELISTTDLNGNPLQVPRYECNLILTKRQSAASVIRGIRVASSLMLRYGVTGLLELVPETTLGTQQPVLPDGSNSIETLDGGWPAYEFSDGSASFSGIVRNQDGSSTLRLSSRSIAETSNRLSVEFQDETNEYQQDSLSIVDADDSALIGYEISSQSTALGIANFSQATRVLLRQLDKSIKGNLFVQFQTSFRALKVRPGDIIAVTYVKEGLNRTPFRVIRLSPTTNYQAVTILAQIHNDDWYSDSPTILMNSGRQPGSAIKAPKPLIGTVPHIQAGDFEFFDFAIQEELQASTDGSATDMLTVFFSQPSMPSANLSNLPLVSLSPQYESSGGSLPSGSFYYAVTAVDPAGNEGPLSFTVPASIVGASNSNQVTITGLSLPAAATKFNVYRGTTPQELYRITPAPVPIAASYTDSGSAPLPYGPPDANFDHANFYYRHQYAGPITADLFSASSIGWSNMGAIGINYSGLVVRIVEGRGRGQERTIASNTETTLNLSTQWSTVPDATSQFVIAEGSWKFAAVTATSPARFEVPYEAGAVIQILGRAANVENQEAAADLCPLTQWALGGGRTDAGVAGIPNFVVSTPGAGALTLSEVTFQNLANTSSVTSGTLTLFAWNELLTPSPFTLAIALTGSDTELQISQTSSFAVGDILQIGAELITILSPVDSGNSYKVERASLRSSSTAHSVGDSVLLLTQNSLIVPFASGFFENRASQNFLHRVSMPDYRICAAQFYVTNSFGDGEANQTCYLSTTETGLRTLSGGQFSLQVNGFIATQQNAAPPMIVEASHAVRDIRATLTQPSAGFTIGIDLLQNGTSYCSLEIAPGSTSSDSVASGLSLPPLVENAALTMNVSLNPVQGFTGSAAPGRDLTVTIRL